MNPDDEYTDRLREAFRAEAEEIVPAGDGLARIRERTARRGAIMRWVRPVAVVGGAAVIAAGIAIGFALTGNDDTRLRQNPAPPAASSSETPSTATPTPPTLPVAGAPTLAVGLPLWPYADGSAAAAAKGTAQDVDPATVALRFTTVHLGFTDNNLVLGTTKSSDGKQAWVSIGYHTEGSRTATAAVIHVVQWSDGPWEVVGTRDTTLSLTQPSYGATGSSPMTAGGKITGVDESIRVAVQQSSSNQPLGVACCAPAGGSASPWSESVSFKSSTAQVLTVVASTGGHLVQHERWALTAVRNTSASNSSAAPATFVAVSQGRIGVFNTSNGALVRWLTSGSGASDPQHVGNNLYFLQHVSSCANTIQRVPLAGGSTSRVLASPSGATVSGYGVDSAGRIAALLARCSDNAQQLYVTDSQAHRTHSTAYAAQPPGAEANPVWVEEDPRSAVGSTLQLAVVVRTGTQAHVSLLDPFTATSVNRGTTQCGDPNAGLPGSVAASFRQLYTSVFNGGHLLVLKCNGSNASQWFATSLSSPADGLAADASGDVIVGASGAGTGGDIAIWSGGQLRYLRGLGLSEPTW
jgi:hypothetical protein